MLRRILIAAILTGWCIYCPSLKAQETSAGTDPLKQLQAALEQRDRLIQDLLQRVKALEKQMQAVRVDAASGGSAGPSSVAEISAQPAATQSVRSAAAEEYEKEERVARAALDRALISHGSLLLPPGTVELDNGISYYNSTSDGLQIDGFTIYPVLIVGDIKSERSERDILLPSLTTRLGLPHDFQLDVLVPYGYDSERTVAADNTKVSRHFLGLGDVEVGLTRELRRGKGHGVDLLSALRWKTTTGPDPYNLVSPQPISLGTGFQSLQGSLTAVKASDPLVFFGSLSYAANLSATKKIQTTDANGQSQRQPESVHPGDTLGFQVGAALAVNPEASLNFAFDQKFTRSTSLNGVSLPGTYLSAAVFRVGTSYVYAPARSVDLGLGIGLSRGAPNFQFSVSFPLRFSHIKKKEGV